MIHSKVKSLEDKVKTLKEQLKRYEVKWGRRRGDAEGRERQRGGGGRGVDE